MKDTLVSHLVVELRIKTNKLVFISWFGSFWPTGSRYFGMSSAKRLDVATLNSDGFNTQQLPGTNSDTSHKYLLLYSLWLALI